MAKRKFLMGAAACLVSFLVVAGLIYWQRGAEEQSMPAEEQSLPPEAETQISLLEYDTAGKSPEEIALWLFDNHGCKSCHAFTPEGLLGLTPQGQEAGRDFQGCPGMLQTVWQTVAVHESEWTEQQTRVRANFVRFGCTACHQVGPTGVGLTEIGAKAALLHMSCSEVMGTVAQ